MIELGKEPLNIACKTENLRKLLIEHPDLPLLVFAGEEANNGDYHYMSCSCFAKVGEYLDAYQYIDEGLIYTDRDDFEEAVEEWLDNLDEEDAKDETRTTDDILKEYEPFWKPCILLYCDN